MNSWLFCVADVANPVVADVADLNPAAAAAAGGANRGVKGLVLVAVVAVDGRCRPRCADHALRRSISAFFGYFPYLLNLAYLCCCIWADPSPFYTSFTPFLPCTFISIRFKPIFSFSIELNQFVLDFITVVRHSNRLSPFVRRPCDRSHVM